MDTYDEIQKVLRECPRGSHREAINSKFSVIKAEPKKEEVKDVASNKIIKKKNAKVT